MITGVQTRPIPESQEPHLASSKQGQSILPGLQFPRRQPSPGFQGSETSHSVEAGASWGPAGTVIGPIYLPLFSLHEARFAAAWCGRLEDGGPQQTRVWWRR